MDNNKKVQLEKLEFENMYTVGKINKITMSRNQVDAKIASQFSEVMKKTKSCFKKKKKNEEKNYNDDVIVENSLKHLIEEDNEIKKTVEEKIASSKKIKELLSVKEITSSEIMDEQEKTGI